MALIKTFLTIAIFLLYGSLAIHQAIANLMQTKKFLVTIEGLKTIRIICLQTIDKNPDSYLLTALHALGKVIHQMISTL